jgi:hypothetical protein
LPQRCKTLYGDFWGRLKGIAAAGIVAIPCVASITVIFVLMQMRYSLIVFSLTNLAMLEANLNSNPVEP